MEARHTHTEMHVLVGKWVSLGIGLLGFALTLGGLLYGRDTGMLEPGGPLLEIIAIAAPIGAVMGLAHSLITNLHLAELKRLHAHVESLGKDDSVHRFDGRFGLDEVARAMEKTVRDIRFRLEKVIAQRRELEVQVRIAEAERQHAEAIINAISDAVIVTDAFNEVAIANASAAKLLGFPLEDARRRPVEGVLTDPALVQMIKDTREIGDTAMRRHIEHHVSQGGANAVYDVSLSCVAGRGQHPAGLIDSDEAAGVVAIMRDVTREKEIAEMKSDFVSNVSHELRTPLSSIKAYMEMLIDGEAQDDETRADFYNIIQGEANRLDRLIDNILNINRIESGVVQVQRTQVSLPAIIKEVVDVMLPQAHAKDIDLIELPTSVFFQVYADKDMIYQAILNLIGNAIKYTPNNGEVSIGVELDEERQRATIFVRDTGIGVPEDALPHLFDKFYRVANHKKVAKGTGLGLNLVKHIIETVHGGRVWVESEVGKGSTFHCSLPLMNNGR